MRIVLTPAVAAIICATPIVSAFSFSGNRKSSFFVNSIGKKKQGQGKLFAILDRGGEGNDSNNFLSSNSKWDKSSSSTFTSDSESFTSLIRSLETSVEEIVEAKAESAVEQGMNVATMEIAAERGAIVATEAMLEIIYSAEIAAEKGAEYYTELGVEVSTEARLEQESTATQSSPIPEVESSFESANSVVKGTPYIPKETIDSISNTVNIVPDATSSAKQMVLDLSLLEASVEAGAVGQAERDVTIASEVSVATESEIYAERNLGSNVNSYISEIETAVESASMAQSEEAVATAVGIQSQNLSEIDLIEIESACAKNIDEKVEYVVEAAAEAKAEEEVESDVESRNYQQMQPAQMQQTVLPLNATGPIKDLSLLETSVEKAVEQVAQLGSNPQSPQAAAEAKVEKETEADIKSREYQQLQPTLTSAQVEQATAPMKDMSLSEESVEKAVEQAAQLGIDLQSLQAAAEAKVEKESEADVESRDYQKLQPVVPSSQIQQATVPIQDVTLLEASVEKAAELAVQLGTGLQSLQAAAEDKMEKESEADVERQNYDTLTLAQIQQAIAPMKDLSLLEASVEKVVELSAQIEIDLQLLQKAVETKVEKETDTDYQQRLPAITPTQIQQTVLPSTTTAPMKEFCLLEASVEKAVELAAQLGIDLKLLQASAEAKAENETETKFLGLRPAFISAQKQQTTLALTATATTKDMRFLEASVEKAAELAAQIGIDLQSLYAAAEAKVEIESEGDVESRDYEIAMKDLIVGEASVEKAAELAVQLGIDLQSLQAAADAKVEKESETDHQELQPAFASAQIQHTVLPLTATAPTKDFSLLEESVESAVVEAAQLVIDLRSLQTAVEPRSEKEAVAEEDSHAYRDEQPASPSIFMGRTYLPLSTTASMKDLEASVEKTVEQAAQLDIDLQLLQLTARGSAQRDTETEVEGRYDQQLQHISTESQLQGTMDLDDMPVNKDLYSFEASVEKAVEQTAQLSIDLLSVQEAAVENETEADMDSRDYQTRQPPSLTSAFVQQSPWIAETSIPVKDFSSLELSIEEAVEQAARLGVNLKKIQTTVEVGVEIESEIVEEDLDYRDDIFLSTSAFMLQTTLSDANVPVKNLRSLEASIEKAVELGNESSVEMQSEVDTVSLTDMEVQNVELVVEKEVEPTHEAVAEAKAICQVEDEFEKQNVETIGFDFTNASESQKYAISANGVEMSVEAASEAEVEFGVEAQMETKVIPKTEIQVEHQFLVPSSLSIPTGPPIEPFIEDAKTDIHLLEHDAAISVEKNSEGQVEASAELEVEFSKEIESAGPAEHSSVKLDVFEYIPTITSEPLPRAFIGTDLKGPGLVSYLDALQDIEPARSYFNEVEVLRERPSLSVEKAADKTISVGNEVEIVSTVTVSKFFSIPSLSSEEIKFLSPMPVSPQAFESFSPLLGSSGNGYYLDGLSEGEGLSGTQSSLENVNIPQARSGGMAGYLDSIGNAAPIFSETKASQIEVSQDSFTDRSRNSVVPPTSTSDSRDEIATTTTSSFLSSTKSIVAKTLAGWKKTPAKSVFSIPTTTDATGIMPVESIPIDVSVPYDAAARNAYESSDESATYPEFKAEYEADAIDLVKSKRSSVKAADDVDVVADVAIPYDAAARNAYESSDKSTTYPEFKAKYEVDAIELVKSKRSSVKAVDDVDFVADADVAIPYDAAARIADLTKVFEDVENIPTKMDDDGFAFPSISDFLNKIPGKEKKVKGGISEDERQQLKIKMDEDEKKTRTQRIMEKTPLEGQ